jgi:hypothetical protein
VIIMLTKAFCAKCPHSYLGVVKYAHKDAKSQIRARERACFQLDWKSGLVNCQTQFRDISEPPPEHCPYALEHILNWPNALAEAMMMTKRYNPPKC